MNDFPTIQGHSPGPWQTGAVSDVDGFFYPDVYLTNGVTIANTASWDAVDNRQANARMLALALHAPHVCLHADGSPNPECPGDKLRLWIKAHWDGGHILADFKESYVGGLGQAMAESFLNGS